MSDRDHIVAIIIVCLNAPFRAALVHKVAMPTDAGSDADKRLHSMFDESVVGQSGEFRFENSLFMLCSGAPFVYCVKAHSDSGIFFRFIVHSEHVWNEIRVGASEPVGDGQNARQESRKRKA